jgi:hypothetical protein
LFLEESIHLGTDAMATDDEELARLANWILVKTYGRLRALADEFYSKEFLWTEEVKSTHLRTADEVGLDFQFVFFLGDNADLPDEFYDLVFEMVNDLKVVRTRLIEFGEQLTFGEKPLELLTVEWRAEQARFARVELLAAGIKRLYLEHCNHGRR